MIIVVGFVGLVVAFGIASLFVKRHREQDVPDPGWTRSDEVFRDPSTGRMMRVWIDALGDRHYVPEPGVPPRHT